ncbi:sigma-70 family RNA polymerase sigma factor [uncultured Maribacter sp.]|uniref:RNA polymerase sigma factor n=1 Tax=uncultured Maribacter sp. TaxID=431308 RepID=UPI00262994D9|nr:sigma-70 family RNA polymerase sigma factor [uncultured Maribacter sp.]
MQLEELITRFQQKDTFAFERLHAMYAENICGVINTIVKDDNLAEEICQDVFVKVWSNALSYNSSKGRFFTWIVNIARNAAIDVMRSKNYKNQKKNLPADYFVSILESKLEDEETDVNTKGLHSLVSKLKEKCIQVIELLYFKGYTQKEVSEELDIPIGTVKTRNRSCISQLRENMQL